MEDYKIKYNKLLKRYYNGCEYLSKNPDAPQKDLDLLLHIKDELNIIIEKYNITDSNIILNGFKN